MCFPVKFFNISPFPQCLIQNERPFARRILEQGHKLVERFFIKVICKTKTVPAYFERTDRFLKCFLIIFTDAHNFTHCLHLGSKLVFKTFKFLKSPACKFHNDIIAGWSVFIKRSLTPVRYLIECYASCKK